MAKMIAVIGSPGSGKTTVTMKLAQELYCATTNGAVIYLSPSLKVPAIGVLFPNYTPDSIFSLGEMLDKTDIIISFSLPYCFKSKRFLLKHSKPSSLILQSSFDMALRSTDRKSASC